MFFVGKIFLFTYLLFRCYFQFCEDTIFVDNFLNCLELNCFINIFSKAFTALIIFENIHYPLILNLRSCRCPSLPIKRFETKTHRRTTQTLPWWQNIILSNSKQRAITKTQFFKQDLNNFCCYNIYEEITHII